MALTNIDFTEMFGCIGVVISWPLKGTTTPGTLSHTGFAPSMGMGPLTAFAGIVTGWLTANGTSPTVSRPPTIKADTRILTATYLLRVRTNLTIEPPLKEVRD